MATTTDMIAGFTPAPVVPATPVVTTVEQATPAADPSWKGVTERFTKAAQAAELTPASIVDAIEANADGADVEPVLTINGIEAPVAPAPIDPAAPVADPATEPVAEPAPEPVAEAAPETVVFKDRNGKEFPIDVTGDPETAEVLRATLNDGMRKQEFNRLKASLDKQKSEVDELRVMLKAAPEAVVNRMDEGTQVRALEWLLATHWDKVQDKLVEWYGDPNLRRGAQLDMRDSLSQKAEIARSQLSETTRRQEIGNTIESLIPEGTSPEDAQDFFNAAAAHLSVLDTQRGNTLTAAEVPALLERHRTRYGFTSPAAAAAPNVPSRPTLVPTTPAVAAPASAAAEALAKRAVATRARFQSLPAQQAAAAMIAPQSAGAAPAVQPPARSYSEASQRFVAASQKAAASGAR